MQGRLSLGGLNAVADLGAISDYVDGYYIVHISGTWVGTIQTKSWSPGNGLTVADRQPVPYSGKSGALVDPTATGISTNGVYKIPASVGQRIVLEMTAYTSGAALIDPAPSPISS